MSNGKYGHTHNIFIPVNNNKLSGWRRDCGEKSVRGFSNYDVMAPSVSIVSSKSCARNAPLALQYLSAICPALRRSFQKKNSKGVALIPPPVPARVRTFIGLAEAHISGSEELVLEIRSSNVIYVCECFRCVRSFLSRPFSFSGIAWCAAWASLL